MDAQQKVTEASQIQCLECGKWYRALPRHISTTHNMDDDDYRIKHEVPKGTPLVCKEWSERASEVGKTHPKIQAAVADFSKVQRSGKKIRQSRTTKAQRKKRDMDLHRAGTMAAAKVDRTKARREAIAPYPVTTSEVVERLGVVPSTASSFLRDCVKAGTLIRIGHGVYDVPGSQGGRPSLSGSTGETKIFPVRLPESEKDAIKGVLLKGETLSEFARLALAKEVASRSR
jgi:hypothetical protein